MSHPFLVYNTCYFHHEWETCYVCGRLDKPDEPTLPFHEHHDEELEEIRMAAHPEHLYHDGWVLGRGKWYPEIGWLPFR